LIKGSDLAIEFHMNASTNTTASGVETISLPKDKVLAQKLSGAIAKVFDSKLRGDKGWIDQSQSARGKLGFVSNKGLIVELEFISNPEKLKAFQEKYWLAARAVADVIIEHLNK
jgi:N-acetylmuramoyl-L-alanine amidase